MLRHRAFKMQLLALLQTICYQSVMSLCQNEISTNYQKLHVPLVFVIYDSATVRMCLRVGLQHVSNALLTCAGLRQPRRPCWSGSLPWTVWEPTLSVCEICFLFSWLVRGISCSCNALWFVESAVSCPFLLCLGFLLGWVVRTKWGLLAMLFNSPSNWHQNLNLFANVALCFAENSSTWLHVFAFFWHVNWNMTNTQLNNQTEKCNGLCQCVFFFLTVKVI